MNLNPGFGVDYFKSVRIDLALARYSSSEHLNGDVSS
jgi:hypothetical protein